VRHPKVVCAPSASTLTPTSGHRGSTAPESQNFLNSIQSTTGDPNTRVGVTRTRTHDVVRAHQESPDPNEQVSFSSFREVWPGGSGSRGVRVMSEVDRVTSIRQAAAVCNVTPPVVRRWLLSLGLIPEPPWTLQQLHQVRDLTDPESRRRGPRVAHGTMTRWKEGCSCTRCRQAQNDLARARFRRKAHERLPVEMRQQLVDAIHAGQPFRQVLRDLGLNSEPGLGAHQD
jgi:hypothetical protein